MLPSEVLLSILHWLRRTELDILLLVNVRFTKIVASKTDELPKRTVSALKLYGLGEYRLQFSAEADGGLVQAAAEIREDGWLTLECNSVEDLQAHLRTAVVNTIL